MQLQLQLQGIEDDATAGGSELCFPLEPVLPDPDNFFFQDPDPTFKHKPNSQILLFIY